MEKEIFEQPKAIENSLEGRLGKNETQEGIFGAGFEAAVKDVANIGDFSDMKNLVKSKSVILIGLIILTAYMGYKITDVYSICIRNNVI